MIGQSCIEHEFRHRLLPQVDCRHVNERIGEPFRQHPLAHRGDGTIEHGQQRTFTAAFADRSRDFQAAAARLIDLQGRRTAIGGKMIDVLQRGLLRLVEIVNHRPCGPQGLVVARLVNEAESFQVVRAKVL